MGREDNVVAGESSPATVPDETAIAVPCDLYPAEEGVEDRKHRGAFALDDSSEKGKAGEAPTKAQVSLAESAVVEADAMAKVAVAKARVADAEASARLRVLDAEADAKVRVAEAQAATKVRVATAEALEADLKIVKLRKELEVLTGVPPDGADEEQRSGTVLLEDVDLNEKKNSSPRSSRFQESVALYTDTKHMLTPSGELRRQGFFPEDSIVHLMGVGALDHRRQLKARVTGKWKRREDVPKWAEGMANYERHAPRLFEIEYMASRKKDWVVFEEEEITGVQMPCGTGKRLLLL